VRDYTDVEGSNDAAFVVALAKQPLAVAIEADQRGFQVPREGEREGGREGGGEIGEIGDGL
jgi:hypothetical protein